MGIQYEYNIDELSLKSRFISIGNKMKTKFKCYKDYDFMQINYVLWYIEKKQGFNWDRYENQ